MLQIVLKWKLTKQKVNFIIIIIADIFLCGCTNMYLPCIFIILYTLHILPNLIHPLVVFKQGPLLYMKLSAITISKRDITTIRHHAIKWPPNCPLSNFRYCIIATLHECSRTYTLSYIDDKKTLCRRAINHNHVSLGNISSWTD